MGSYPVEIRRCQHIRVNGTQCGSPALKDKEFCYYHQANRPEAARLYLDGERYPDSEMMIPPFEDAHSIQMVLRQVLQLLFERRIERKDAGLALYAMQIASSNLKQMQAEKPRPTQVVVEPEKVAETPIGQTPWTTRRDRPEMENEDWDVAAADYLRKINHLWEVEFRECKSLMEEKAAEIGQCLNEKPEAPSERLREAMAKVQGSLERIAKIMEKHIGINEIRACAEEPRYVV